MDYDVLIIGGGAAGLSCALVLGSAQAKDYAKNKTIGIVTHQKNSHLQTALFNNVLGLEPGTLGKDILSSGTQQLATLYPHVQQITKEKVKSIEPYGEGWRISTNKRSYTALNLIIAVGYTSLITIKAAFHQ